MAALLFTFTADEHAVIDELLGQYPGPTAVLKARVATVIDRLIPGLQGLILTEESADEVLAGLVDRIVGSTLPDTEDPTEEDELRGSVVDLLVRHFVAEARPEIIRRLLGPPRN